MSIYRARLRNTSNALAPRVSSEQIRLTRTNHDLNRLLYSLLVYFTCCIVDVK